MKSHLSEFGFYKNKFLHAKHAKLKISANPKARFKNFKETQFLFNFGS